MNMGHVEPKLGRGVKLKKNLVNTLEVTFSLDLHQT